MDTMGFLVGCGRGHTHGVMLKDAVKHPGHFFRNPEAGGGVEYTGIGHHRESVAKEVGVPGVYDYGPQRSAWVATLVTNWMGDAGFLKRIKTEMRRFNTMGDTTWCKGQDRSQVQEGRLRAGRHRGLGGEPARREDRYQRRRHRHAAVERREDADVPRRCAPRSRLRHVRQVTPEEQGCFIAFAP